MAAGPGTPPKNTAAKIIISAPVMTLIADVITSATLVELMITKPRSVLSAMIITTMGTKCHHGLDTVVHQVFMFVQFTDNLVA